MKFIHSFCIVQRSKMPGEFFARDAMPTKTRRSRKATVWQGCYDAGWRGLIVDDAFSHPAKMARGLVARIFDEMFVRGWLRRGDVVVDPFGGIGTTGIEGASRGCRVICCELEPKFVELARRNFELHRATWEACGDPLPVIVQGDSRRLCEVVGVADCVVSSPPYAEAIETRSGPSGLKKQRANGKPLGVGKAELQMNAEGYGSTPGQLGGMKPGTVDSVISSPPYAQSLDCSANEKTRLAAEKKQGVSYGACPGNLGNLRPGSVDSVVSSPPYEGSETGRPVGKGEHLVERKRAALLAAGYTQEYVDGIFTPGRLANSNMGVKEHYGDTAGQLGQEFGETFWHAAREIVQQCHAILKPGGIAAWVTKDFVRNKARVPFSADWLKLCESCGFELVEWVHASLVKDLGKHADLYGDVHHRKVERKSFFRRLAEKKGSPRIDHEDVIFVRKR